MSSFFETVRRWSGHESPPVPGNTYQPWHTATVATRWRVVNVSRPWSAGVISGKNWTVLGISSEVT